MFVQTDIQRFTHSSMSTSDSGPIRILLVDDHALVREILRKVLEEQDDIVVVGETDKGSEALAIANRVHPDLVLLDLDLGSENGLDYLPELLAVNGETRVLVLTGARDYRLLDQAVRMGAMGILSKDKPGDTLIKAIKKVHQGEIWLDRSATARLLAEMHRAERAAKNDPEVAKIQSLTDREREIITLVASAMGTKDIASKLFISEKTVRNHLASIFSKLEISDRLELVVYANRHGLAAPPQ